MRSLNTHLLHLAQLIRQPSRMQLIYDMLMDMEGPDNVSLAPEKFLTDDSRASLSPEYPQANEQISQDNQEKHRVEHDVRNLTQDAENADSARYAALLQRVMKDSARAAKGVALAAAVSAAPTPTFASDNGGVQLEVEGVSVSQSSEEQRTFSENFNEAFLEGSVNPLIKDGFFGVDREEKIAQLTADKHINSVEKTYVFEGGQQAKQINQALETGLADIRESLDDTFGQLNKYGVQQTKYTKSGEFLGDFGADLAINGLKSALYDHAEDQLMTLTDALLERYDTENDTNTVGNMAFQSQHSDMMRNTASIESLKDLTQHIGNADRSKVAASLLGLLGKGNIGYQYDGKRDGLSFSISVAPDLGSASARLDIKF